MLPALTLAPLTLAAVLVLSGVAKLRDPDATASMIALLRLPEVLRHRVVPRALPVVELVTAVLLLTPWRATYAAGTALSLGLFAAFLVVIARAMTFDPRPTCGCFGRVGDHRVSARTVVRNVLLLALAVLAAATAVRGSPAGAALADLGAGDLAWLLMAVVVAVVAVLVLGTGAPDPVHEHAPTVVATQVADEDPLEYRRLPIPRGVLVSADQEAVPLREMALAQAQLLVLVDCWCGSTFEVAARLPRWREALPPLGVQLVHTQRPFDEPALAGLEGVWWDPSGLAFTDLRATTSPTAVLLGADGLLAGGPVGGVEEVERLVADIAEQLAEDPAGTPDPAPDDQRVV